MQGCCFWIKEAAALRHFSKSKSTFDLSKEQSFAWIEGQQLHEPYGLETLMPPPSDTHNSLLREKPSFFSENPSPFDVFPILCYLSPWTKLAL